MKYPKIYLTLDNCFAIKRWTKPSEWMPLIKKIGFQSVQASFDNEIDFLYSPEWYLEQWFSEVERVERETGIRVDTFFTGYQTYRTAGLAHADREMADYLKREWMEKAVRWLGKRQSHMGVSFFAMTDEVLQNPERYSKVYNEVIERFADIAKCAAENKIYFCSEAMYAPHQPSWTIKGTKKFLKDCYAKNGNPIYTTVDVGHMVGQRRFRRPSRHQIEESIETARPEMVRPGFWIGAEHTVELWKQAVEEKAGRERLIEEIMEDINRYEYLFSDGEEDSSPYAWLEELACYSPILHMQQTNGVASSHAAFTEKTNKDGIIKGKELLQAIAKSYEKETEEGMPPKVDKIYLAFEIFGANAEYSYEIVDKLTETAKYWKTFVPEDGIVLDKLLEKLN